MLDPTTVSGNDVRLPVGDVLRAPNYRDAATRIQKEIGQLPTSAGAETWIEVLCRTDLPDSGTPSDNSADRSRVDA